MGMKIYSSRQVVGTLGTISPEGFGEDEMWRVEENVPRFVRKAGVDGQGSRSMNRDFSARVILTLMNTSDTNDELSALHEADKAADNGAGVVAFRLSDRGGRSLYFGAEAWIAEPPKPAFGREASHREWTIEIDTLSRFDGGN